MKGKKKREPIRFIHFLAVLFLIVLSTGIFHVWVNSKRTQTGYELSELKREIEGEREYSRKLKLEMAYLRSPKHLEDRAMKEFGLRYPSPRQVVYVP